jgi:crossover junction endodeoxyribonuclease RusA
MRIITKEGKAWIKNAQEITQTNIGDWVKTEKEKVIMEIHTFFPDNRRRDCHNTGKILYDALEGILYDDDRYLLPRYIDVQIDKENPRIEIVVYKMSEGNEKYV